MRRIILLCLSVVLGVLPLAGIAGMAASGMLMTVDGLFTSLILLTLSGVFLLNALWEMRDRGWLAFLERKGAGGQSQKAS